MSSFSGPNIVEDNLQICIDFSNSNCYSGGSTTSGNYSTFYNLVAKGRNDGYLKNACTLTSTGNGLKYVTTGGANNGAVNNVGDRIDINTSAAGVDRFGANSFSIMFWINQSGEGRMMSTGSAGTGVGDSDNCIWYMYCDTGTYFWWNSGGGNTNNITASGTWHTPGTWQLIGFTYSYNEGGNDIVRCYTNGVQQFSAQISTATHSIIDRSNQTDLQWTLGGGYSASCYTANKAASIGAFYLYNAKLTDAQMLQNFNALRGRFSV